MSSVSLQSIPELCHSIWDLESKLDLLDLEIAGVKIWQACRMHIYYKLAETSGLYEQPHVAHTPKKSWAIKLRYFFRSLTLDNPFLWTGCAKIGIFQHSRSKFFEGRWIDIYSHFLCQDLTSESKDFLVFERPFLNEYMKDQSFESRQIGIIDSLASAISNFPCRAIPRLQQELVGEVETAIQEKLNIAIDLQQIFSKQLKRFKVRRYLYGKLLDHYNIKKVYLVVSYYLGPLIDSCKRRGIPVYEIQHGVISTYHLGYSFPDRHHGSLNYFPDYLMIWGGKWPTTKHLPIAPENVIEYGFRYFEANAANYMDYKKVSNRVLVVSQTVHGNSLAQFILRNIGRFEGWEVIYKLHPSEFNQSRNYSDLVYLEDHVDQFQVARESNMYELLAQCRAVVGVFSTALFEALALDCDVYVVPLSGWEYMEELLQDGKVLPFEAFPSRV